MSTWWGLLPDQAEIHRKCISNKVNDRLDAVQLLGTQFAGLNFLGISDRLRTLYYKFRTLQPVDIDQAWQDLHRLTQDQDSFVRSRAVENLGTAFSHVPNKDQAWQDLIKLTQDQDSFVQESVAYALRTAFSHVPNKDQVWQDLIRLTQNQEGYWEGVL